jgi:hypothetical protein
MKFRFVTPRSGDGNPIAYCNLRGLRPQTKRQSLPHSKESVPDSNAKPHLRAFILSHFSTFTP